MTEETLINLGADVRVERRHKPEADGSYRWVVYRRQDVPADEDGKRTHPVHGQETTVDHVWMIVGDYPEAEAKGKAAALAG